MKETAILAAIPIFLLLSCTTTKYVSTGVDIASKYSYGYISELTEYGGSAGLYGMDVEIFQLIGEAGITMIGEGEIEELTDEQKSMLLTIKYAVSSSSWESVVTITFFDYKTKRPLLNCTGASAWGIPNIDIPAAKKKALQQVRLGIGLR